MLVRASPTSASSSDRGRERCATAGVQPHAGVAGHRPPASVAADHAARVIAQQRPARAGQRGHEARLALAGGAQERGRAAGREHDRAGVQHQVPVQVQPPGQHVVQDDVRDVPGVDVVGRLDRDVPSSAVQAGREVPEAEHRAVRVPAAVEPRLVLVAALGHGSPGCHPTCVDGPGRGSRRRRPRPRAARAGREGGGPRWRPGARRPRGSPGHSRPLAELVAQHRPARAPGRGTRAGARPGPRSMIASAVVTPSTRPRAAATAALAGVGCRMPPPGGEQVLGPEELAEHRGLAPVGEGVAPAAPRGRPRQHPRVGTQVDPHLEGVTGDDARTTRAWRRSCTTAPSVPLGPGRC